MLNFKLKDYAERPITFEYRSPTNREIELYLKNSRPAPIIDSEFIKAINFYYSQKIPGTRKNMIAREIVVDRIYQASKLLSPSHFFKIFDTFRTIKTQEYLFTATCNKIRNSYPGLNEDAITLSAQKYCAHPFLKKHFEIPPHNTGGAIDLTICDKRINRALNFGTVFDCNTALAETDFFEKKFHRKYGVNEKEWNEIKRNRRILYHLMKEYGFINYCKEWWHYSFGDCIWANVLGMKWIFESMENII